MFRWGLVALLGLTGTIQATHDEGLIPEGYGAPLVESIVERIQASCVFPEDKLLLRRIAFVESQDGHDSNTYRDGYHGGIWQVKKDII